MSQQLLNRGSAPDDGSAESIYSGAGKINDNFTELYASVPFHLVTNYGAVGNYNPDADTGTDDTEAIQDAVAAAAASGGYGIVMFPAGRAYKLTETIIVPNGVSFFGSGFIRPSASGAPPQIFWRGAPHGTAGSLMLQMGDGIGAGSWCNRFNNISFHGGRTLTSISQWADTIMRWNNGVDTGTVLEHVWLGYSYGNCIEMLDGVTNMVIAYGRFDRIGGYAIYGDTTSESISALQIHDITYDSWDFSMGAPYAKGFMFLNGEASTGTVSIVQMTGCHPEINAELSQTYAAGTNTMDKHGVIRLGVNASNNRIHHIVTCDTISHSPASASTSHSFFQVTSTSATLQQHLDRCLVRLTNSRTVAREPVSPSAATGNVQVMGNIPDAYLYPWTNQLNVGEFVRGGWAQAGDSSGRSVMYSGVPQVIAGTGAPSLALPNGYVYLRTDGSSGTDNLYVRKNSTWVAIA